MSIALPILDNQPQRPSFANGPRDLASVKLLRISVTDRCNLRCVYCMPDEGVPFFERDDLLTADDFFAVAQAARSVGVSHFKITGGEPTVRRDLVRIVERISSLGPGDLSMTTNGLLLRNIAADLRRAGLHRMTISWDSMQPQRFDRITGGHFGPRALDELRRGIDAAVHAGFTHLKINVVVMAGINDDEVIDFARLSLDRPWTVRFIEYMPLGDSRLVADASRYTLDNAVVKARIAAQLGPLIPVQRQSEVGAGPAQVFRLPDAVGRLGFISAMSKPFCESCNRLRLTARGEMRSCLFDGGEIDLLPALRRTDGPDLPDIVDRMRRCVALKPEVHSDRGNRAMSQLGG